MKPCCRARELANERRINGPRGILEPCREGKQLLTEYLETLGVCTANGCAPGQVQIRTVFDNGLGKINNRDSNNAVPSTAGDGSGTTAGQSTDRAKARATRRPAAGKTAGKAATGVGKADSGYIQGALF